MMESKSDVHLICQTVVKIKYDSIQFVAIMSTTSSEMLNNKKNSVGLGNKCNQCDYVCVRARDLRRHLKNHHGNK